MEKQGFWKKYGNCIIAALTIIVNIILLSVCFDFYYDLNDDVMMKDIMAGVYTGTPDGHNMQTLYLLGAFISLWYRLCRNLPWYGVFLLLCQMGSLYLVGFRLLQLCRKRLAKAGVMLLFTVYLWGILLPHMMALQYTLTCTMLAASAVFLFMTTPAKLTCQQFVIWNIPSIFLVILAYQLRTEMLLLVFPFICLAGLFRWAQEEKFFQKENYAKYGIVLACILLGMILGRLFDFAAYGSGEWKDFLVFFEKRTQVYDFHMDVLTSGEHREYLASIGLDDARQELLVNYNFGLDEGIDTQVLGEIAAYAADGADYGADILKQCRFYLYRTLHEGDAPYNRLVLCAYLCVVFAGSLAALTDRSDRRKWSFLWELVILGMVRTLLWMFILIRGRDPERITHSLYLAELALLMGMLATQFLELKRLQSADEKTQKRITRVTMTVIPAALGLVCAAYLSHSITAVRTDAGRREEANRDALAITQYCRAHPENFYFEDVYSTVGFSQRIFGDVDNSLANYDIMGGWMCKSPLYREKLERFGIATMEEGLLYDDSVYFIMATGTQGADTDWMRAYYETKGIAVSIQAVDWIGDRYAVYKVMEE